MFYLLTPDWIGEHKKWIVGGIVALLVLAGLSWGGNKGYKGYLESLQILKNQIEATAKEKKTEIEGLNKKIQAVEVENKRIAGKLIASQNSYIDLAGRINRMQIQREALPIPKDVAEAVRILKESGYEFKE